jgi:Uma2 family endonuclease
MPNAMHQDFSLDLASWLKWRWAKPSGGLVRQEVNLTTLKDESNWPQNYRIPDIVMLDASRLSIDKNEYMAGAPLVVIEIRSPGDEAYEKLPFYAGLGVPEVWIFDRDTREPELYALKGGTYELLEPDGAGWHHSPATGLQFRHHPPRQIRARIGADDSTSESLPTD